MSQENVELIYRAFDALSRHDFDAFVALMDDDVEIIPRTSAIEGESGYSRHEGLGRWWSSLPDVFPDYSAELVEYTRARGDLYLSPFSLARFEENAGRTNTSFVSS